MLDAVEEVDPYLSLYVVLPSIDHLHTSQLVELLVFYDHHELRDELLSYEYRMLLYCCKVLLHRVVRVELLYQVWEQMWRDLSQLLHAGLV